MLMPVCGTKAEFVLSRLASRKGEATFRFAFLGDDATVVVKGFLDGDEQAYGGVACESAGGLVPLEDFVVACLPC
jgi:hypothetical protein